VWGGGCSLFELLCWGGGGGGAMGGGGGGGRGGGGGEYGVGGGGGYRRFVGAGGSWWVGVGGPFGGVGQTRFLPSCGAVFWGHIPFEGTTAEHQYWGSYRLLTVPDCRELVRDYRQKIKQ